MVEVLTVVRLPAQLLHLSHQPPVAHNLHQAGLQRDTQPGDRQRTGRGYIGQIQPILEASLCFFLHCDWLITTWQKCLCMFEYEGTEAMLVIQISSYRILVYIRVSLWVGVRVNLLQGHDVINGLLYFVRMGAESRLQQLQRTGGTQCRKREHRGQRDGIKGHKESEKETKT